MKKKVIQPEIDALRAQVARALADYDNLKKRTEKEREAIVRYANQELIKDLLPRIEDLEKAQAHIGERGLAVIVSQIREVFTKYGVVEVRPNPGERFDETHHEAVETVEPGNNVKAGIIAELVSPGAAWRDGGLILPAQVRVYGKVSEKEEELKKETLRGDYV